MFAVQTKCPERKVSHACMVKSKRQESHQADLHAQKLLSNNPMSASEEVNGLQVSLSSVWWWAPKIWTWLQKWNYV